jgi:hypothetical protein
MIEDAIQECIIRLGYDRSTTIVDLISKDRGHWIFYIQSVVGDDEVTTSNSYALGPLLVSCGPCITGIRISWKDVGDSPYLLNYAEGWVFTPLSGESTFEGNSRRHASTGVPFILDPVKQKYLSPVRKQSEREMDLESKMVHLAEIASWTDSSWFTYGYHQMALLLATVSFDFNSSRSFPFLYKTEGGCGGAPPWNNIDTGHSMIHHYTRGKSTRAILGVMKETVDIHQGRTAPSETFFLKAAHLAQASDQRWLEFTSAYKALQRNEGLSRTELRERLREMEGSTLPPDILALGTNIEPRDPVIGTAVSHLRSDGLVFTELDVKLILDKHAKAEAVFGDTKMSNVLSEIEESQRIFKANTWKTLSHLVDKDPELSELYLNMVPKDHLGLTSEAEDAMRAYYSLKARSLRNFTSLAYSDTLKIFKAVDIKRYFERGDAPLRMDFLKSEGIDQVSQAFPTDVGKELERKIRVSQWLDAKPLVELLTEPLPPGVGPDDGRVFRNIFANLEARSQNFPTVVILISSDRDLVRLTAQYLRTYSNRKQFQSGLLQLTREAYIRICLTQCREYYQVVQRTRTSNISTEKAKAILERSSPNGTKIQVYNYILGCIWPVPREIQAEISAKMSSSFNLPDTKINVGVEYDLPNIERGLERTVYDKATNRIYQLSGGYIPRKLLNDFPTCWAELPYLEIKNLPELSVRRDYRTLEAFRPGDREIPRLSLVNPMSHVDLVQNWRSGVKTPRESVHARSASWRSGISGSS